LETVDFHAVIASSISREDLKAFQKGVNWAITCLLLVITSLNFSCVDLCPYDIEVRTLYDVEVITHFSVHVHALSLIWSNFGK
jgi:hypothetical protein